MALPCAMTKDRHGVSPERLAGKDVDLSESLLPHGYPAAIGAAPCGAASTEL
jgi:hypothetical protein